MINVGILGYGTVGSGVYEILKTNCDIIEKRTGEKISVKRVLDLRDFEGDEVENILTHDYNDILNDDSIDIVAEVMGGVEPAFTFSKMALEKGKSVVTSNKAVVAEKGTELIKIAEQNNVNYMFEASCGGTIPIIRALNTSLTADKILKIKGILNGTTNYILSRMTQNGEDFGDVLKDAQKLGYAEADPTADVEGHDSCRKIAILSSLAYGKTVDYKYISTEGITKITKTDIDYAKSINCVIKLIGLSENTENGVSAGVFPCLINKEHPLACVNGAYNAIFVNGDMSKETMYYGSGAGKLPTAAAVVGDIIDEVKSKNNKPIYWDINKKANVLNNDTLLIKSLIRICFDDKQKAKSAVEEIFGVKDIIDNGIAHEFAFITKTESNKYIKQKIDTITKKGFKILNVIRVEE